MLIVAIVGELINWEKKKKMDVINFKKNLEKHRDHMERIRNITPYIE